MNGIIIIISCLFFIVLIVTIGLCKASAAAYRQEEEILDNEINNEINKSWN